MIVVNFYGGPGCGKTTLASSVFARLKRAGINCELVTEFAKQLVWEGNIKQLEDQLWVFANQQHCLSILEGQVEVVVTDSPLLLSLVYNAGQTSDVFKQLVVEQYLRYDNMDIFVHRGSRRYVKSGRLQTVEQAKEIDAAVRQVLDSKPLFSPPRQWEFDLARCNRFCARRITRQVIERVKNGV